jgi:hypothetical protein
MQRLRIADVLVLALLLQVGCAPRPIYRQPEVSEADGGEVDDAADDVGAPDAQDGPDPDRPAMAAAEVAPDLARPDLMATPDAAARDGSSEAPAARKALLVVAAPGTLGADDAKLKARLESKSFMVTVGDDNGDATQAQGVDLVVLSGSVASATIGRKYVMTPVPLICLEAFSFGNMGMTGPTRDTDFGIANGTQIAVALETHAIAAGHPNGNLAVAAATTSLGWGLAPATADRIATLVGMGTRDTAFAYEAGQMMATMVAPARRVGLFAASPTPDRLNLAGWQMFDAAVDWMMRP